MSLGPFSCSSCSIHCVPRPENGKWICFCFTAKNYIGMVQNHSDKDVGNRHQIICIWNCPGKGNIKGLSYLLGLMLLGPALQSCP